MTKNIFIDLNMKVSALIEQRSYTQNVMILNDLFYPQDVELNTEDKNCARLQRFQSVEVQLQRSLYRKIRVLVSLKIMLKKRLALKISKSELKSLAIPVGFGMGSRSPFFWYMVCNPYCFILCFEAYSNMERLQWKKIVRILYLFYRLSGY